MRPNRARHLLAVAALAATASPLAAQAGVEWVEFTKQPGLLGPGVATISNATTEVDFATADLDLDGDMDVVAARRRAGGLVGFRTDVLLMNESGVLVDRTALYAVASDVGGDLGFLTPTSHTDAQVGDFNADGWPDVLLTATLSDGQPKAISHPRVCMNLQDGGSGWLGLRFENARIPQLLTVGGLAVAPRFSEAAVGDVDNDGFLELYFTDHDVTESGVTEATLQDLNDRLLGNDTLGFFGDASASCLTTQQLQSAFGCATQLRDLNDDGALDIVKCTTALPPVGVRAVYNNPANAGAFLPGFQVLDAPAALPYGFGMGDLNRDALDDLVLAEDAVDRYLTATGIDSGTQHLVMGPKQAFQFVSGGDDGFSQHAYIEDLDADGWNDVVITDVDIDLVACFRRMHVYHNLGGAVGGSVALKEEAEFANGGNGTGWKSVVGLTALELRGTFDVAIADFDGDGDLDMLQSRCAGTSLLDVDTPTMLWRNESPPASVCQVDLGFAGPGNLVLSLCGEPLTAAGSSGVMTLTGAGPSQPLFVALSLSNSPTPVKGGVLVPTPIGLLMSPLLTDGSGGFSFPVSGGAGAPLHVYVQAIVKNGVVFEFSNAVDILLGT